MIENALKKGEQSVTVTTVGRGNNAVNLNTANIDVLIGSAANQTGIIIRTIVNGRGSNSPLGFLAIDGVPIGGMSRIDDLVDHNDLCPMVLKPGQELGAVTYYARKIAITYDQL